MRRSRLDLGTRRAGRGRGMAMEPNMIGAYGPWAASLAGGGVPRAELQHQIDHDGLHIEHLGWQLPYGPPTEALFLKPKEARGPLPAVLALHDHGGNKYFGTRKIAQMGDDVH